MKCIVTLPDHELSNAAAGRSKHWIKILSGVDTSKSNGYAFIGDFRRFGDTIEVDEGTWFLSYVESRTGSGKLNWHNVALCQVQGTEVVEVDSWQIDGADRGWALHVRDEIHAHMTTPTAPAAPDVDALLAERDALLARLAEIDALLPEPEGTTATTREAAQLLGVSVRTIQRWAATGKVDARKDTDGRWIVTIILNPAA